jgi:8-oxo-dGTP pyrophosphatase MutT (NUDIX family)
MSRPRPWERLGQERICDCRVFHVDRVSARSPTTGVEHDFFCIASSDWVNVVPVTATGDVVLVRQFRHGSQKLTLEIPGGLIDPGEAPAQAAARELLEETGYRAERVIPLGVLNPNPALFGNRLFTFVAPGVERVAEIRNEGAEETSVELIAVSRVAELVRTGEIDHALVIAGLYQWQLLQRAQEGDGW